MRINGLNLLNLEEIISARRKMKKKMVLKKPHVVPTMKNELKMDNLSSSSQS